MIQDLPNQVTEKCLITAMNEAGFSHAYDFIHVPINPAINANCGYGLVHFKAPGLALLFKIHLEGQKFANCDGQWCLQSARIQCLSVVPANLEEFDESWSTTKETTGGTWSQ